MKFPSFSPVAADDSPLYPNAREAGAGSLRRRLSGLEQQRGIALVVTLILLSVITFLAVAFLFLSTRERASVTTAVDQTAARLAAEAAAERAQAEVLAPIMATGNKFNYSLRVSTNYINPLGFQSGNVSLTNVNYDYPNGNPVTGADLERNVANLYYSPRPPVFVRTNTQLPGARLDFRYYLDLNRNGRYDTNGVLPELSGNAALPYVDTNGLWTALITAARSNLYIGDPEWVGILERSDRPHSSSNRFVSRFTYVVIPTGLTLDLNTIHNQAKLPAPTVDGFSRNMGVGPWEMNLASFLVDLNTNYWQWNAGVLPYAYNTNNPGVSTGTAFEDALALTRYRYAGNWSNLRSVSQLFGASGADAFRFDLADGYGSGPLMLTNVIPGFDGDAPNRVNFSWPGADNPNHFFTTQDLFDRTKTTGAGQAYPNTFVDRLQFASLQPDSYNRYTYYRLLSQLGTDSSADIENKLHLNYANVDAAGQVIPDGQTNFLAWNPLQFFTNAADRLLRKTFANTNHNRQLFGLQEVLSITNIPVVVSNQLVYSASLHRIMQLAANIVDASTNYAAARGGVDFPSVFRPEFKRQANGDVYIAGWTEVGSVTANDPVYFSRPLDMSDPADRAVAGSAPNQNIYGVPWVIGAKKGMPNFNEFSLQSVAQIGRKLQLRRPTITSRPNVTNQLFTVGVSNMFAFEAWNSYRSNFNRAVQVVVANDIRIRLAVTNDARFDLRNNLYGTNATIGAVTNIPANAWAGYGNDLSDLERRSFIVPLATNINFLPEQILRTDSYTRPQFVTDMSQGSATLFRGFEQTGRFPIPEFAFTVTNRIRFIMLDSASGRVLDYVHLSDLNGARNLSHELASSDVPVLSSQNQNLGQESMFWQTNRIGGDALVNPPQGVVNQIEASLGNLDVGNWNNYGIGVSGQTKQQSITGFRAFFYGTSGNTNLVMQAPFTPTRKTSQYITWQANDPLVHYTAGDLLDLTQGDGIRRESPNQPIATLENIGDLNTRFEPWGGNPRSSAKKTATVPPFSLLAKDPGVRASDDWNFPTNKFANVGWLGRVHRGTPWQTVYLKASTNLSEKEWTRWTGNQKNLDAQKTLPVNDRVIFDVFTTAFDANTARGRLNVNQDGQAAWSAVLGGVIGLTNTATDAQLYAYPPRPRVDPFVLDPAGLYPTGPDNSPLGRIWKGIHNARTRQPNGYFAHLGDVLAAPELTEQSPLLNQSTDVQKQFGIDDATYERLPQMIMGLLKGDENPRFAIYAYGQSLKPANNSIVRSGAFFGLCTNYQITAEFATRTVVRIEGSPTQPRAVVESFNILPPE